jgi:hypothetical protein|tara:strand:- start:286 stop:513 length:228 start_codon:yes stop_codon:yes gene_type:complete
MRLSDAELDLLLDIISTHLVRHEDGQDIAQGWEQQDVQDLMVMLTEETLARNDLAIAEGGLMVLIDPFSLPKGEA